MTTNNYPNIGYRINGHDFNYFNIFSVSATTFGGSSQSGQQPDYVALFPVQGFMIQNLGSGSTNIVEYSLDGYNLHGQTSASDATANLTFINRSFSMIWFRVKSGSTGPINISLQAWGLR